MKLDLTAEQVERIIQALDYVARNEAGQTQEPNLYGPEDFDEFDLARDIEARLHISRVLSAQWTTHPQTGEPVRIKP